MGFLGALFTGLVSTLASGMGGGADNSAGIAAQDQANKLRITSDALRTATQERLQAEERNIQSRQASALDEQQALQGLVQNFRSTLLGGRRM